MIESELRIYQRQGYIETRKINSEEIPLPGEVVYIPRTHSRKPVLVERVSKDYTPNPNKMQAIEITSRQIPLYPGYGNPKLSGEITSPDNI